MAHMETTDHNEHAEANQWVAECQECQTDLTAIDWLLAVRKYGLETANRMFPS